MSTCTLLIVVCRYIDKMKLFPTVFVLLALLLPASAAAKPLSPSEPVASAAGKTHSIAWKVNSAPVNELWTSIINYYTGGSYSLSLVNQMWQSAPRSRTVFQAAVHNRIPYRLMLGVWGIESGYGRAWNHFGLIGPATGNLRHDAFYAAHLFSKFYEDRYGRPAV